MTEASKESMERRIQWESVSQEGEFDFHRNNVWRQTDSFVSHTADLFRYFGYSSGEFNGKVVLDVGAGSRLRTRYFEGAKIVALEPLAERFMQEIAWCDLGSAWQVYSSPAEKYIAELEGLVDFAVSINVIDHVFDPVSILSNIRRYLKPDGKFLLSVDLHSEEEADHMHPVHLDVPILHDMVVEAGFEIVGAYTGLPNSENYGHGVAYTLILAPQEARTRLSDDREHADRLLAPRFFYDGQPHIPLNAIQLHYRDVVSRKVATSEYAFEQVSCCICRQAELERIAEKDRYGLWAPVAVCRRCGLVQSNPRMTQEAYSAFYDNEYRKLYIGEERPSLSTFFEQYRRGIKLVQYLLPHLNRRPEDLRVLEVGCGAGGVLFAFREAGFSVKGIDLDSKYLDYGRRNFGLDLELARLSEVALAGKPDIILYSHVLEHVLDLPAELALIKQTLAEEGLLCIEVPGIKSIPQVYAGDLLRYLQNAHTYHFTLRSLTTLMESAGFTCLAGDEFIQAVFKVGDASRTSAAIASDYEDVMAYLQNLETNLEGQQRNRELWGQDAATRILLVPDWASPGAAWEEPLKRAIASHQFHPALIVGITLPEECLTNLPARLVEIADAAPLEIVVMPEPSDLQGWSTLLAGTFLLLEEGVASDVRAIAKRMGVRVDKLG